MSVDERWRQTGYKLRGGGEGWGVVVRGRVRRE